MAGGRALGDLVKQRKTLVDLPLFNELSGKGGEHIGLSARGVGLVERGTSPMSSRRSTSFAPRWAPTSRRTRVPVPHLGTHEAVDNLAVDHGVHGRIDWTRKA